jgi:hypothetical protein
MEVVAATFSAYIWNPDRFIPSQGARPFGRAPFPCTHPSELTEPSWAASGLDLG